MFANIETRRYLCVVCHKRYENGSEMSNWESQQIEKSEQKERDKVSRETLGKFFYDLAKLVFTTMALVGGVSLIIEEPQGKQVILLVAGLCFTTLLAYIGFLILKRR